MAATKNKPLKPLTSGTVRGMFKKLVISIFLLTLILSLSLCFISQLDVFAQSDVDEFLGFSGYVTSQAELENTVVIMKSNDLNCYRVSFRPSWQVPEGTVKGYNTDYIDYLLSYTDFFVIVDGNHLYPPTEASAQHARNHWSEVKSRIFQTLERYPNNSRVAVELINEYVSDDYNARMQDLIDEIRREGYTNPLVTNKLNTVWQRFSDPQENTYQGMHYYFNTWDAAGAMQQINIALSKGITKILNTEIGASSHEYKDYTQANIDDLESFLYQSKALGINNCVWMNNDAVNWQGYTQYGFTFNPTTVPAQTPSPPPEATANPRPTQAPAPTPTAHPTPTPSPTPTGAPVVFEDSFESGMFNLWSGKGGTGTHSETIETANPQHDSCNAKFLAGSKSKSCVYKNLPSSPVLYFQQYVKLTNLPPQGSRLCLGTIQSDPRNAIEVFLENSRDSYYWGVCTSINGRLHYDRETTASSPQLGTYYEVEICRDTKAEKSKLWVDGALKVDVNRSHVGEANKVYCGITWTDTNALVYVDNVKVSTAYIGGDIKYLEVTQTKHDTARYFPMNVYSGSLLMLTYVK